MKAEPGGVDRLLASARARLRRVSPAGLDAEVAAGALVVDIRPIENRQTEGELPGAIVIDRNVLEWRLDPTGDHRIDELTSADLRVVLVCNEGYQSSLAAAALQDVGLSRATDLVGGYRGWRVLADAGEPVVPLSGDVGGPGTTVGDAASPGPVRAVRGAGSLGGSGGARPAGVGAPGGRSAPAGRERLADLREDYAQRGLRRGDLSDDPFAQFEGWFSEWMANDPYDGSAVVVATADASGRPSARFVLLKGISDDGFVFYTNTASRKGADLAANPVAALCFGWISLERQVRVEGPTTPVSSVEADGYWASRPRGSQLGAWASEQSRPIDGRSVLEDRLAEVTRRFEGGDVPRPPAWGGYRLHPEAIEFWQGRRDRLHDRFRYSRDAAAPGGWRVERLSP